MVQVLLTLLQISCSRLIFPLFFLILLPMNLVQFERGIDHFNRGYFFEAHDILEDIWRETTGPDRLFLQGLIQVSVGFYHLFNQNYKGAVSQFTKGLTKLEPYKPSHRKVELAVFSERVLGFREQAERGLVGAVLNPDESSVPKIIYLTS